MSVKVSRVLLMGIAVFALSPFAWAESVRVTAATLNVRAASAAGASVVGTLRRGDVVEVIGKAGEWYQVRTGSGLTGFVSTRWVEPWKAPERQPETAAAPAAAPAPAPAAPRGVAIAHDGVGCVVAGRHPRLSACITPSEDLGRARVLFRASDTSPWFSVPLQPDGACFSALLPKPRKAITGFQYFVEALDRSFAVVLRPEDALDRPYAPRVVGSEADCERGRLVAAGVPSGSVVVSLARDAAGRVLEAAVAQGGGSASLASGFSLDGVSLAGSGPASAGSSSAPGGGGGSGMKLVAIGGGVLAAGAAVAVAGGGGGGDAGSGGGSSGAAPGAGTAPGGGGAGGSSLTGRWTGLAGSGDGLRLSVEGCTFSWDFILDLSQSGSNLGGTGSAATGPVSCPFPLPIPIPISTDTLPVNGTASASAVTLRIGTMTFTGNAAGSAIEGTARHEEAPELVWTWRVRR